MSCFGDIVKHNNNFDETLNTTISRFSKCKTSADRVLITESTHLVATYETAQELVPYESWTFPQLNRLSVPVIACLDTTDGREYMVAIQEPNSLTKWSFGEPKTRLEKHFFNTKIVGLIDFEVQNVEPIVVFETGFCQSMSIAVQTRREEHDKRIIGTEECIQSIDGLVDKKIKDLIIIYLITRSIDSNDKRMKSIYKISFSSDTDVMLKIESYPVVNAFNNWSLCKRTQNMLAITGSDDGLVVYSLDGKSENEFFKPNGSSIDKVISFVTTIAGSVCLIGKSKDSNHLIELWETRYGSKLGSISLPSEPLTNDCKIIDDSLFITCFKCIISIPLRIQSISLSQIVGKNASKESAFESQVNHMLKSICTDFESGSYKSYNDINTRLTQLMQHIGGNVAEDIILKLVMICCTQLSQNSSQELKDLFESVVSLPFNDLYMISRLKSSKLKFSQILLCLSVLSELLPSKKSAVFDWISILIDSHINEFIMNPNEETIKVLEAIDTKVDNSGQFYEHLGQIKTLIDLIINKSGDKGVPNGGLSLPKPKRGQYCIEILRF